MRCASRGAPSARDSGWRWRLGVPASLVLWHIGPVLRLLGQDPALIAAAEPFVRAAMWGFVPALWFVVLRNFIARLERPRAAMVIMLIGVSFNAIAAYGLIFGRLGLPALGLRGAGIAAALTNFFLFVGLLGFILRDRQFRRFHILGRLWRPDWARFREIFRIGLPIGVTLVMEVGLFACAGFAMGWIGTAELAAHQIALQCASVTFMVPLGLAQAATVRVGLAAGGGDAPGIRRAGIVALAMGGVFMLAMATVMWTAPGAIVGLFIDAGDPANAAVVRAAVTFLAIAALFQLFDGGQVIGAGALRGLKDTRWPMVFAGLAYWAVGMSLALGLGLRPRPRRARHLDRARRRARGRGRAHDRPVPDLGSPADACASMTAARSDLSFRRSCFRGASWASRGAPSRSARLARRSGAPCCSRSGEIGAPASIELPVELRNPYHQALHCTVGQVGTKPKTRPRNRTSGRRGCPCCRATSKRPSVGRWPSPTPGSTNTPPSSIC